MNIGEESPAIVIEPVEEPTTLPVIREPEPEKVPA